MERVKEAKELLKTTNENQEGHLRIIDFKYYHNLAREFKKDGFEYYVITLMVAATEAICMQMTVDNFENSTTSLNLMRIFGILWCALCGIFAERRGNLYLNASDAINNSIEETAESIQKK